MPLDGIAAAILDGTLSFSYLDATAFDRFAGLSSTTFQELSARTGIPAELLTVVREAVGFAEPRPEDHVRQERAVGCPIDRAPARKWSSRPLSSSGCFGFARTACAASPRRRPLERLANRHDVAAGVGPGGERAAAGQADLGSQMAPSASRPCCHLPRAAGTRLDAGDRRDGRAHAEGAGLHSRLDRPPAMCFLDITGYTRLTEERGDEAAAELAAQLADLVRRSSQEHGGTPVKWLGDGVMFYFREPGMPCSPPLRWWTWSGATAFHRRMLGSTRAGGLPGR